MVAPTGSAAGRPEVRYVVRTRRRFPRKTLAVLVVLALLTGKGLGWIGGGDQQPANARPSSKVPTVGTPEVAEAARGAERQPTVRSASERPRGDGGVVPVPGGPAPELSRSGGGGDAADAGPGGSPSGPLAATEPPTPPPSVPSGESRANSSDTRPAVDPDRFGSLVSLLQSSTADRRFGSAMQTLQRLRELPLDAAQQTALVQPSQLLENALANACSGIVSSLCEGQVLEASRRVDELLLDEPGLVVAVLAQSLALCGLHGDLNAVPVATEDPWPQPKPLAKGRSVRATVAGEVMVGRVIDSRAELVTLRVQRGQAVTFPTLPTSQCEPIDVTPAEAVEMAFAALQAGKVAMARLWLACATMRKGEAAAAVRRERLQQLLR